jgi:glycosyltransferase involved in cell wall biosynthesis
MSSTDAATPGDIRSDFAQRPARLGSGSAFSAVLHRLRAFGGRLAPLGTARGRWARTAVRRVKGMRDRAVGQSSLDLAQILDETVDRKGIVVYPPFIDWTWMRQRPHQLMSQFARAGYLSFFCSPKTRTDRFRGFVRAGERLYLCDSLVPLYELPNPVLFVNWPYHWEAVQRFHSPLVIYDYLDDLGVSADNGVAERRKVELHRKLVDGAEVVVATARRLHAELAKTRPDALYCPNGVDYEYFRPARSPSPPSDIADLVATGKPIIGYYGALARWFDYDLVAHAAMSRRDCQFLLIGPDFDGTSAAHRLGRLPNVRWIGEKKYEELPAYLNHFSVATIPFVVNDITKAVSPVKLFEYMAAGKPIVTTDLPECRRYASVLVARDPAEYVTLIDDAIRHGQIDCYRRLLDREARANTWEVRAKQILGRLATIVDCRSVPARHPVSPTSPVIANSQ